MSRTIEIISKKMKYRKNTFPAIAPYDDAIGNYMTGQQAMPGDTNGLSKEEIEDPSKISAAKRKKFPFVIQADTPYHIKHMSKLDIGLDENGNPYNPKDHALYVFWKSLPQVAESEKKFKPDSNHIFYIRDVEQEAQDEVSKMDNWYAAMQKIKENTSISNLENVALMLNYSVKNFNLNISAVSKAMLEKKLYQACMDYPNEVLKCFEEGVENDVFILKLVHRGIISRRAESFYDGDKFLGRTIKDVLAFIESKEGAGYRDKWGKLLMNK